MHFHTLDPMQDSRWDEFVVSNPRSSVFHHKGWLQALAKTYSYRPVVLTSAPPGERLSDGIVFCEVNSWITGSRLVSLPFADHCEPLLNESRDAFPLAEWIRAECRNRNWKYAEIRPLAWEEHSNCSLVASQSFWFHTLELERSIEQIFCGLHKSSIQRRIRRAERERLTYERGCTDRLLKEFYRLVMITRRRHRLLPQPIAWFRNLVACMSPHVEIRVARRGSIPIAAVLTLSHRQTIVYKYGCSDERYHHLSGMPFLFWKLIEESKDEGAAHIDLGRTDLNNAGLVRFKDELGACRRRLMYLRYPEDAKTNLPAPKDTSALRRLFSVLPDVLSSTAGRMLYRHIG